MDEIANRKRVLLISPDFGFGGAEKSIADLSLLLAPWTDLHFVVFNQEISPIYVFKGQLHSLEVPAGRNGIHKIICFVRRVIRLKKLKRELNISVSISYLEGSDYINVLSRRKEKIVLSLRGSKKYDSKINGWAGFLRHKFLIPWVYNHADQIVVVARGIGDELLNSYRLRADIPVEVISNFYNAKALIEKSKEILSDEWVAFFRFNQVIIAVGRLSKEKGFDILVDLFAQVRNERPGVKLVLIGSGPFESEIRNRINHWKLKLSDNMEWPDFSADLILTGFQQNPLKFVARSTLFILSSSTEVFPNAMMEAMCLGIPVVATDCPYGPREILSNGGDSGIYRKFGILMPQLSNAQAVMSYWISSVTDILGDEEIQRSYRHRSAERAQEYGQAKALRLWQKVIG